MNVYCPNRHRAACSVHLLERAEERGVDLTAADIERLEQAIEKLRPAFEVDGQDRYWVTVHHAGQKFRALYDIRLHCLVTVWVKPQPSQAGETTQ